MSKDNKTQRMKVVCAWCGESMGKKDGNGVQGISHGLCQKCLAKLMAKVESKGSTEEKQDEQQV